MNFRSPLRRTVHQESSTAFSCRARQDVRSVMSSLELFENIEQTDESTRITAAWLRDENLETALPNPPKLTTGKVVAHENGFAAV